MDKESGNNIKKEKATKENLPEFQLVVIDSFKIDYLGSLALTDYNKLNEGYLFFDYFSKDILIVDETGKIEYSFNKYGHGADEYDGIRGLSFFDKETIIIRDNQKYSFYTLKGEPLKSINYPFKKKSLITNKFNIEHFLNEKGDTILIFPTIFGAISNSSFEVYYREANLFGLINISEKSLIKGIPYEKSSIYRKKPKNYSRRQPEITFNKREQLLYALFPYDPNIYIYSSKNLVLQQILPTHPEFFNSKIFGQPFGELDRGTKYKNEQLNSQYKFLHYLEKSNLLLVQYYTGIEEEFLVKERRDNYKVFERRKNYLQLLSIEGKESKDILLPPNIKAIVQAIDLNHIISPKYIDSNDADGTTYYISKLVKF